MTRIAVAAVLMSAALGLARADDKAPKDPPKDAPKGAAEDKGLKALEGTYKLLSVEKDGKLAEKGLIDAVTVQFKGDEFVMAFSADDKKVAKIAVKPDDKLSTIDFAPTDGEYKGKTLPGIYKLDKGELTIAFSEKGDRPKEFKSEGDAYLMKLKKVEK
jgi:uncharacterized protein (TIGR03067 family)